MVRIAIIAADVGDAMIARAGAGRCSQGPMRDLLREWPGGPFDIIMRRNAAFACFAADKQRATLDRLAE